MREETINCIFENKIISIVRNMEEKYIFPLAKALLAGGINMMEITFSQLKPETFESTARSILSLTREFAGRLLVGAGTVMDIAQVDLAREAGALYIVSPNTDTLVIEKTRSLGMVSLPGAMTPSECQTAHEAGADFVKLFPASDLGTNYLKAIRAPLSHIKFLAVGGINEKNAADFIRAGAAGLGIGGNLVNKDWIIAGEWEKITALARQLVDTIKI